jgi:hypothetical protein
MIPVEQTNGSRDCFRACIASILELPIEALPEDHFIPDRDDWFERTSDYLTEHFGLHAVKCAVPTYGGLDGLEPTVAFGDWTIPKRGYWIATVNSINLPRLDDDGEPQRHAVVMHGINIVWDPSTKRKRTDFLGTYIYYATVLIPLDPARAFTPPNQSKEAAKAVSARSSE